MKQTCIEGFQKYEITLDDLLCKNSKTACNSNDDDDNYQCPANENRTNLRKAAITAFAALPVNGNGTQLIDE
ncbi:9800_t:CDS:2, partial [Paraglomus brasilianum]